MSDEGGRTHGGGRCSISLKFALGPGYAAAGDVITLALDVAGPDDEAYVGAPLVSSGFSVSVVENAIQLTVLSDDDVGGGVSTKCYGLQSGPGAQGASPRMIFHNFDVFLGTRADDRDSRSQNHGGGRY